MSSLSIAGVGAQFYRWDGNDWEAIAEVRAIVGPSLGKDVINTTSLDTEVGYNEYISGFVNGGEVSLAMSFTRANYELFKSDFESSDSYHYGIMLPDDEQTFFNFVGLVTEVPLGIVTDDKIDVNIKIKVSGILELDDTVESSEQEESTPVSSSSYQLLDFVDDIVFLGGEFDFENNLWLDQSGNNNHAVLKGASARTGNGSNLDYTITGLLTSDTVEVVSGSDLPTIPFDGTLRIGPTQIVYGVTIRRYGAVWAIIPFCEPKINENIPTISYDVSGNGRHAVCDALIEANITTQDSYFYLLEHGYSLRSEDVLEWDTSQWTGDIETYDAVFSGVVIGDTQGATRNIQPTSDGLGCSYYHNRVNFRLRKYGALVIGKRYRMSIVINGFTCYTTGNTPGLGSSSIGIWYSELNWFIGNGTFDENGIASSTTFELKPTNTAVEQRIEFYDPKVYLLVVVPGLLSGVGDAVGGALEFEQDGFTLLQYAANLEFPENEGILAADQKGYWSDVMLTGVCVNGRTYKIEETSLNHFGSGLVVNDEFISDGTELLDRTNRVRELILIDGERGFLFTDSSGAKELTYSDFEDIRHNFCYCKKPKIAKDAFYSEHVSLVYPRNINTGLYGWKKYKDGGTIKELTILKSDVYLNQDELAWFNSYFKSYQKQTHAIISFVWDHLADATVSKMRSVFENRGFYMSCAINYSFAMTLSNVLDLVAHGHEITIHTGVSFETETFIPEYKDFYDTSANYTESELSTYYAAAIAYYNSKGFPVSLHKIYPGGGYDAVTKAVVLDYFLAGYMASGSATENKIPITHPEFLGRQGLSLGDSAGLQIALDYVDDAIANGSWIVFYAHPSTEWVDSESWANFEALLDYIAQKTAEGERIRQCPVKEAFEIIQREI